MPGTSRSRSRRRTQYDSREYSGNAGASIDSGTYDTRYERSDIYTAPASSYGDRQYNDDQDRSSRDPSGYEDDRNARYTQDTPVEPGASKHHSTSKSSRQQREPSHPNLERGVKALGITLAGLWAYKKADDYFEGGSEKSSRDKRAEQEAARRERERNDEEVANDLYYKRQQRKRLEAEERHRKRYGY